MRCPKCKQTFPSGFKAESPTQMVGCFYVCSQCRRIVSANPSNYLEKTGDEFKKAMRVVEIFVPLPTNGRIEVSGAVGTSRFFNLESEVEVKKGVLLTLDRAFIKSRVKE